jgi:glyoxylase-like metal-dependent hydrolase (beta-lactamase superfamily II)
MKIIEHLYWYSKDKPVSHFLGRGFSVNIFVLEQNEELWVIDAGVSLLNRVHHIFNSMKRDGLDPTKISKIFITHAHPDHSNAVVEFKKWSKCECYIPELEVERAQGGDYFFWEDQHQGSQGLDKEFFPVPLGLAKWFVRYSMGKMPILHPDHNLQNNEIIHGPNFDLHCLHTPGHTVGHFSYFIPQIKALFCGDLIDPSFDHKASLNFSTSDYAQIYNSILELSTKTIEFFCAAHAKQIYQGEEICHELLIGTLQKLDYAKERTIELLSQAGLNGMRLKDFYGKFPKSVWMLQDQMCVPFSVIKVLEKEGKIQFQNQRFFLK